MSSTTQYHVIHDCDTGSDDAIAVMMLLNQNSNNIPVAITCVNGNTELSHVKMNNMRILKLFDKINEIPVYSGCSKPLVPAVPIVHASNIHGSDGFGGQPNFRPAASQDLLSHIQTEHAVNAIIRLSKKYSGTLKIVATGPLTNIAMAVRMDPDLPSRVHSLYIMGGSLNGYGNITAAAEFNFYSDPEAVLVVLQEFSSSCDTYVVPFEYTTDNTLPFDKCDQWLNSNSPKSPFAKMVLTPLYNWSKQNTPRGMAICDAYTMAVMLDPDVGGQPEVTKVKIELAGFISRGYLAVDHLGLEKDFYSVKTYKSFSMDRFYQLLLNSVK